MVEILMAWDSKRQFMIDTNPHGGGEHKPAQSKEEAAKEARMNLRAAAMSRKTG
jgi:hypothetical protein